MSKENPQIIIEQIKSLLDSLSPYLKGGVISKTKVNSQPKEIPKTYKGVVGGIIRLVDEDFLNKPRSINEVSDELKKDGYVYKASVTAVALLRLNRRRILTRVQSDDKKNWLYVKRK